MTEAESGALCLRAEGCQGLAPVKPEARSGRIRLRVAEGALASPEGDPWRMPRVWHYSEHSPCLALPLALSPVHPGLRREALSPGCYEIWATRKEKCLLELHQQSLARACLRPDLPGSVAHCFSS